MAKFLSTTQGGDFSFKVSEINEITLYDSPISDDLYNEFFDKQSQGKHLRLVSLLPVITTDTVFDEVFEEYTPETVPQPPTIEERLAAAESAISALMGV